jgi:hypothetical protein
MKISGKIIKAWVFKNTLFYLVKVPNVAKPIIFSSRDIDKDTQIRKDGSISFTISLNKYKTAKGTSLQYFGNKKALAESDYQLNIDQFSPDKGREGFAEYDPYNDAGYLESPDEEILLIGSEPIQQEAPVEGGVSTNYDATSTIPDTPIYSPPSPPPPPPEPSTPITERRIRD